MLAPAIAQLAVTVTSALVPYIPFLLKFGDKAGEEIAKLAEKSGEEIFKKMGGDAWEQVKGIWANLHPKIAADPMLNLTAQQVAVTQESLIKSPKDAGLIAQNDTVTKLFQDSIAQLLANDPSLVEKLKPATTSTAILTLVAEQESRIAKIRTRGTGVNLNATATRNSIIEDVDVDTRDSPPPT